MVVAVGAGGRFGVVVVVAADAGAAAGGEAGGVAVVVPPRFVVVDGAGVELGAVVPAVVDGPPGSHGGSVVVVVTSLDGTGTVVVVVVVVLVVGVPGAVVEVVSSGRQASVVEVAAWSRWWLSWLPPAFAANPAPMTASAATPISQERSPRPSGRRRMPPKRYFTPARGERPSVSESAASRADGAARDTATRG
jgi:hypothetical protein